MIAGQLPANPATLSPGSGPVDIYDNLIQANLANDDGGGLRFLMAGNFPMNVYNNFIVNNVSTHEGGGIGLNDAPNVRFFNNTVMKNLTTATAVTSNGVRGAGRALHLAEQRPAAGDAAGAARRSSATRSCSTTSSGTTGPGPRTAGATVDGHRPRRRRRTRSTTGTWALPTAPGCSRRRTRSSR